MRQRRNGRAGRQMSQTPGQGAHHAVLRGAERVWHDLRFKDLYRSGKEFELMGRAMGFGALAMLTVFPLLVVVAAASAASRHGVARWVVYGMGLTGSSAQAVVQLFAAPSRVLGTTSVFSLLLLAVFGVTFAGSVQAGFERVWGLPAGPWHKIWRQAVWLIVFIAYIYAAATVGPLTHHASVATVVRVSVAVVLGIAFFWWGLHFLVGGRVSYRAALPGAVATVAFLAGLRAFSALVFQPLIVAQRGHLRGAGHRADRAVVADRRRLGHLWRPVVRALVPRRLASGLGGQPPRPHAAGRRGGGPRATRRGGERVGPWGSRHTAWVMGRDRQDQMRDNGH